MVDNAGALHFLPLGGSNEIGMNLNLFGYGGHWLMVDLGITFGDDTTPGLDVILPDTRFIEGRRDDLLGLVLTHGHEDHIGAVPYLVAAELPGYATPFTASLVRRKLADAGLLEAAELIEVPLSGGLTIGPFDIDFVRLTHSIPEPNGLAITTPAGVIYHTGDWKFDPDPVIGGPPDYDRLRALGEAGVLALIGDSTNVFEVRPRRRARYSKICAIFSARPRAGGGDLLRLNDAFGDHHTGTLAADRHVSGRSVVCGWRGRRAKTAICAICRTSCARTRLPCCPPP